MPITEQQCDERERPYHVGNVRETLLGHAGALLSEGGPASLNLRTLSARTGVALGSVYHHFASKAHLLAALAVRGFEQLEQVLRQAAKRASERIVSECVRAYFDFAWRNPQLYSLMYEPSIARHGPVAEARKSAFAAMEEVIAAAATRFGRPLESVHSMTVAVWTCAHGAASLAPIEAEGGELVETMIRGLEALFLGDLGNRGYPNTVQPS